MDKPFPLIYREFKDAIVKAINDTHLDIGVVQLMLEPIVEEVYKTAEQEARIQIAEYERSIEEVETVEEVKDEESLVKEEDADESLEFDPLVD